MNIGLLGYGKMGKMIEQLAQDRGHSIVAKVDAHTRAINFDAMDIAIDFSIPEAAFTNITACLDKGVPVVSGTTGWLARYDEAVQYCHAKKGAFIYASNFSLGVNLFFELNTYLAKMMAPMQDYKASMEEIHHTQKLDAPSGTGITLAEGIVANTSYKGWQLDASDPELLPITAKREGAVPGTHSIAYQSAIDTITITHEAHSRKGFALGAIIAAEWIVGKTGVYTMKDVLGLKG